jgi:glutathione S-transferase
MTTPLKLQRHPPSGHSHRVQLALPLMGLPFEMADVDLMKAAHKSPAFLKLNPFGQMPVLEDGDTVVFDSNAILVYLAAKFDPAGRWMPRDAKGQADVQAWFSVAARSYIAAAPEGNVDLAAYAKVRGWLARVEALPGFMPFGKTAVGLAA